MTTTNDAMGRLQSLLRARRFSEVLLDQSDLVTGPLVSSIGYECVAVALAAARQAEDSILLSHRNHHHLVACGADLVSLYGEIFGKDEGKLRGRAGPMHVVAPDEGVIWTSTVIAGAVPLAAGVALACQRRGSGVVVCSFGDGAMGEGVVSEAFNFACLNTLPVVFVCENNAPPPEDDSTYTTAPVEMLEHAARAMGDVAASYGMHELRASGSTPAATSVAVADVIDRVRGGGGPVFLEVLIHPWPARMVGVMPSKPDGDTDLADAGRESEPGSWAAVDPVLTGVREALDAGASYSDVDALDSAVLSEVRGAAETAIALPPAPAEAAVADVWGTR